MSDKTELSRSRWMKYWRANNRLLYAALVFAATAVLIFSLSSTSSYAVPAPQIPREITQPSGEKFTATLYGDEWFNYTAAENGDLIVQGEDGYWYYGLAEADRLEKSAAKYGINAKPAGAQTAGNVKGLKKSSDAAFEGTYGKPVPNRSSEFAKSPSASAKSLNTTGTQKVLVLLVSFKNVKIVNTDNAWSNSFFGDTGKTLKTFYKENSNNTFYFTPAPETNGTSNDGIVRVTLNYRHPNTGSNTNYKNQNIVKNAIAAADAYVNYKSFDSDGDGLVTAAELHIITVVAGNDASYGDNAPTIWPHSWSTDDVIKKDGISIFGDYTQIADNQGGHMTTIGVVAHELGHDIGLPDLYDRDYTSAGLGVYSLMAFGSWGMAPGEYDGASPTHLDAWCKIQLGFADPQIAAAGSYSMKSVAKGGYNILKIETSDPNQYFLVENRQLTGFDAGLAYYGINTGGIAIYHIDDSVYTGNDNEYHKLVDLEEANEFAYDGCQLDDANYRDLPYNNLFRSGVNTRFAYNTTPHNALYNGALTNTSIGVPGSSSGSMTVNIHIFDDFIVEYGVLLRYLGPGGDVSIPAGITTIDYKAFDGCANITSITVPNSVVSIGESAFEGCTALTSISLTNNIKNIGAYAFFGCESLASITIPTGISTIEHDTFYLCTSLYDVKIPDNVTAIDCYAFGFCPNLWIVRMSDSVTYMNEDVFFESPSVKIYGSIGSYAQDYALSHSIPFARFGIGSDYPIQDGMIYVKIPLFGFYRKASLPLYFVTFDDPLNGARIEWSSDNGKVSIDSNGFITNKRTGGRSADITAEVYDQNNNLVSTDSVKVIFYKYNWQLKKLKSQSVVSDNYAQRNMSAEEYEAYEAQHSGEIDDAANPMQGVWNVLNYLIAVIRNALLFG